MSKCSIHSVTCRWGCCCWWCDISLTPINSITKWRRDGGKEAPTTAKLRDIPCTLRGASCVANMAICLPNDQPNFFFSLLREFISLNINKNMNRSVMNLITESEGVYDIIHLSQEWRLKETNWPVTTTTFGRTPGRGSGISLTGGDFFLICDNPIWLQQT